MGSAEGGAAPKDGEGDGESTTAAAGAAAETKPADTPMAEATAAIQKMISVLDAAEGTRERLRAAHACAAETCARARVSSGSMPSSSSRARSRPTPPLVARAAVD